MSDIKNHPTFSSKSFLVRSTVIKIYYGYCHATALAAAGECTISQKFGVKSKSLCFRVSFGEWGSRWPTHYLLLFSAYSFLFLPSSPLSYLLLPKIPTLKTKNALISVCFFILNIFANRRYVLPCKDFKKIIKYITNYEMLDFAYHARVNFNLES